MRTQTEPTSFVVAEYGADGLAWAKRYAVGTPSVVSLVQASDEASHEFAVRVRETARAFVRGGGRIARAVLVGAGATGATVLASRSLAIRALVAPMVDEGEGTMVLHAAGTDRFSMRALADTVAGQVSGTGVRVAASIDVDVADVA
ncbi:MAG: hypothetical protein AAF411_14760 [Myxococcota bacterium]